ncbi:MAG: hypothetical protein V1872_08870, partial [bacterium]
LIGYSGETGAGLPCLHFEFRNKKNCPLNPLLNGINTTDTTPLTFQKLSFVPYSKESKIMGGHETKSFSFHNKGNNFYLVDKPIVSGKQRLELEVFDQVNAHNACGIYSLEVLLDGKKIFYSQFDELDFASSLRSGLVYNYEYTRLQPVQYLYRLYNLYEDFPIEQGISNHLPYIDFNNYKSGTILMKIIARDAAGNQSIGQMELLNINLLSCDLYLNSDFCPHKRKLMVRIRDIDSLRQGNDDCIIEKIELQAKYDNSPGWETISVLDKLFLAKNPVVIQKGEWSWGVDWKLPTSRTVNWAITRARAYNGYQYSNWSQTSPIQLNEQKIVIEDKESPLLKINWTAYDTFIAIKITANELLKEDPKLIIKQSWSEPTRVYTKQIDDLVFIGEYELTPYKPGSGSILVTATDLANNTTTTNSAFKYFSLDRKEINKIEKGNFSLYFPRDSLYKDQIVFILPNDLSSHKLLPMLGKSFTVTPSALPLKKSAQVTFRYKDINKHKHDPQKLGIYELDKVNNSWNFIGGDKNDQEGTISTGFKYLSTYALLVDHILPEISGLYPTDKKVVNNRNFKLSARITDKGMGINEKKIKVLLDGIVQKQAEYDPDRKKVSCKVNQLSTGKHTLEINAEDLAGNKALSRKSTFKVEPPKGKE